MSAKIWGHDKTLHTDLHWGHPEGHSSKTKEDVSFLKLPRIVYFPSKKEEAQGSKLYHRKVHLF